MATMDAGKTLRTDAAHLPLAQPSDSSKRVMPSIKKRRDERLDGLPSKPFARHRYPAGILHPQGPNARIRRWPEIDRPARWFQPAECHDPQRANGQCFSAALCQAGYVRLRSLFQSEVGRPTKRNPE